MHLISVSSSLDRSGQFAVKVFLFLEMELIRLVMYPNVNAMHVRKDCQLLT